MAYYTNFHNIIHHVKEDPIYFYFNFLLNYQNDNSINYLVSSLINWKPLLAYLSIRLLQISE